MRIRDLPACYLNRESLLGEHGELHGLLSILRDGERGFAWHPQTLRWIGCESGLTRRHALLVVEMGLRGYVDRTPIDHEPGESVWPEELVDPTARQLELLAKRYLGKEGRPNPPSAEHLGSLVAAQVLGPRARPGSLPRAQPARRLGSRRRRRGSALTL